jgi:hypothetical protein
VRAAEVDHQAHAKHVERHGGQQKPLEVVTPILAKTYI